MTPEIETFIEKHPDWYEDEGRLVAGFEFSDFTAVEETIKEIMKVAKTLNHHPMVTFGYNTIEIKTVTHDKRDTITDKDFSLATAVSLVMADSDM